MCLYVRSNFGLGDFFYFCILGDAYSRLWEYIVVYMLLKDKAVEAEEHMVPGNLAKGKIKTSGWEVKQVWR